MMKDLLKIDDRHGLPCRSEEFYSTAQEGI